MVLLKHPQLMGYGALRHLKDLRDITNTHFAFKQHIEDFDPRGVSKHLEQLRQVIEDFLLGHLFVHRFNNLRMRFYNFAFFNFFCLPQVSHLLSYELLFIYLLYPLFGECQTLFANFLKNICAVSIAFQKAIFFLYLYKSINCFHQKIWLGRDLSLAPI